VLGTNGTGQHGVDRDAGHLIRGQRQLPGPTSAENQCQRQSIEDYKIHQTLLGGGGSASVGGPTDSTAAGHAAKDAAWHGRDRVRVNHHHLGHAG
jgi:hypothetical protein